MAPFGLFPVLPGVLTSTLVLLSAGAPGQGPGRLCPRSPRPAAPVSSLAVPLRGTTWRLVSLGGQPIPADRSGAGRPVDLILAEQEERMSGSGGCNRLMGGFRLDGDRLQFGALASTRMACPPPLMDLEQSVLQALEQVRGWTIQGRRLLLKDATGRPVLEYLPSPPAAENP